MNRFNTFLAAAFMLAAMLLPNMVQAMEIRQFDKMADQDQAEYIGNLIVGAEHVLTDEGKSDLAAQAAAISDCPAPPGAVNVALPSGLPPALRDAMGNIALPGEPFDSSDVYVKGHKYRGCTTQK